MRTLKAILLLLTLSVPLLAANHPETGFFVEFSTTSGDSGVRRICASLRCHVPAHDPLKAK